MGSIKRSRSILNINSVIKFLTYSDILMLSGWGLVLPILAVFITEQVEGGGLEAAGLAMTVYFVVKSVLQIPIAELIDRRGGEWDDFWAMIVGSALITITAFLYIGASEVSHVYALQVLYGIGGALTYPSWLAIFTRHIDKGREGFEWSFYYTMIDLGAALTAGLGAFIAANFSYDVLFLVVGICSLVGSLFLIGIVHSLKRT